MTFNLNYRGTLHRVLAVGLMAAGLSFADSFITTYAPAGVQAVDTGTVCGGEYICVLGVEDFNSWTGGVLATDFGTNGTITGTYDGGFFSTPADEPYGGAFPADLYGGAGGIGLYPSLYYGVPPYTLTLSTSGVPGVNYFGLWISALDAGNVLQFYDGDTLLYTFSAADLIASLGACSGSNPYCGNPTASFYGQNPSQQYAFVNFFDTNGYFTKIVFSETVGGDFESDNHTVGYLVPVPEPGSFGLFVAGGILLALCVTRRFSPVASSLRVNRAGLPR